MRELRDRLQDILEAIAQIEAEQVKGRAAFDASPLLQVWMVHYLMIIGEAVRYIIDPATKQRYPSVPWRQIAGMRKYSGSRLFSHQSADCLGDDRESFAAAQNRGSRNN